MTVRSVSCTAEESLDTGGSIPENQDAVLNQSEPGYCDRNWLNLDSLAYGCGYTGIEDKLPDQNGTAADR